jgi:threonine dehydratase
VRYAGPDGPWRGILLKDETRQVTSAFKFRGVSAKLASLAPGTTIVTASTGNHGLAVATAAHEYGLMARVYLPVSTPSIKANAIFAAGAEIIEVRGDYDRCEAVARADAGAIDALFVPSFDDPEIIAGHRPLFAEIEEQAPDVDTVFVPVGGGGLVAAALDHFDGGRPTIVGVEWGEAPAMHDSLEAGNRVTLVPPEGGPEGLVVRRVGALPFEACRKRQIRIALVALSQIDNAVRALWRENGIRAERAGAAALAAALAFNLRSERTAVCIVSGGNIDPARFDEIIGSGDAPEPVRSPDSR